jgi:transcriptional regulator with XRE-family HTH domain
MIGFKNEIMKTQLDISELIENGEILNELDFERALITDRKLRVLSKENPKFKSDRKKLRDLIEQYENKNWSPESDISNKKLRESDLAELIAEKERLFIQRRKELIRKKLKSLNLTQQDFGKILGHQSKSYMSELINGISPFSLKDLIVINRLIKIDLSDLVPTFLPQSERLKIRTTIKKLDNPKLKLSKEDLAIV